MGRWLGTMALGALAGALALATLLVAPKGEAAEAPSCRPLVARIDEAIRTSDNYVHFSLERALSKLSPEVLDVIDIVPPRFIGNTSDERVACWSARGGRMADMRTREAVGQASDIVLEHVDFLNTRGDQIPFGELAEAFRIERASGYDGPVTDFLRRRGAVFLRGDEHWRGGFRGDQYAGFMRVYQLEDALTELAALCLIRPRGFTALAQSLGYPARLLEPHPSEKVLGAGDDPAYLAYLDSERDRIVRDCPP